MVKKRKKKKKVTKFTLIATAIGLISSLFIIIEKSFNGIDAVKNMINPSIIEISESTINRLNLIDVINPNKFLLGNSKEDYEQLPHYLAAENQTYIRNDTNQSVLINKAEVIINSYKNFYHTEMVLVQGFFNEYLDFYFVNNGNQQSEKLTYTIKAFVSTKTIDENFSTLELSSQEIEKYTDEVAFYEESFDGGDIKRLFHFNTSDKLKDLFKQNSNYTGITIKVFENETNREYPSWPLVYIRDEERFSYSGLGTGARPEKHHIIELDINNMSKNYILNNINTTIPAKNDELLKVTFVAKQSITIDYNINYFTTIDKQKMRDRNHTLDIYVPLYKIDTDYPDSEVFKILTENKIVNYKHGQEPYIQNALKYDYTKIYGLITQ